MYRIEFYEDQRGKSELWDFLDELRVRALKNKDARIQYQQIILYIELLQQKGAQALPANISKYIEEDIWELRPGNNRVLYFYNDNNTYILLHCFRKKTQKTPRKEIEKAKREKKDYLRRSSEDENMG